MDIRKLLIIACLLSAAHFAVAQSVSQFEYWIGGHYHNTVAYSSDMVLPTGSTPAGMHQLHFRVRDTQGRYSGVSSHWFLKTAGGTTSVLEYWVNEWVGNRAAIPLSSDGMYDLIFTGITLPAGMHQLHFRVRDSNGLYSGVSSHWFMKLNQGREGGAQVLEYWFNDDIGVKHTRALSSADELVSIDITTAGLSHGVHRITFRTGTQNGVYSSPTTDYFVTGKNPFANQAAGPLYITEYTYRFNNDDAVTVPVNTSSPSVTLNALLDASHLAADEQHEVSIYAGRNDGARSITVTGEFEMGEGAGRVVNIPGISLSKILLQPGDTIVVSGINFTPGSVVSLSCISSEGSIEISAATSDDRGRFTLELEIPDDCPEGLYTVLANDVNEIRQVMSAPFRVSPSETELTTSNLHIVYPNNPNLTLKTGNELIVLFEDFISLDTRYQISHSEALREYSYFVELEEMDFGATFGGVVDDKELGGMATLGRTANFQTSFHLEKEGEYIVRIWDKVTQEYVESAPFAVEINTGQLNIAKTWDYSGNESLVREIRRTREPKGVAADGVSRIYLSVSSRVGTKFIESVSLTVLDDIMGYDGTRLLGKVMPATVTDQYSAEANDANSTVAAINVPGQDVYHFWYVAPDDFTGSSTDNNESTRLVKAIFDVTFTDRTTAREHVHIEIVRPALMLVHGLGGSHKTWDGFSLRDGINLVAENGRIQDNRFIVKEAIDVWPDVSFEQNARELLNLNMLDLRSRKSNFEAMNLLMMDRGYASNRVDYICHSMGGCILRYAMEHFPDDFKSQRNYNAGFTNRVITIATPHEGSPLGDAVESLMDLIYGNTYVKIANLFAPYVIDLNKSYQKYRYYPIGVNPYHFLSPRDARPHTLQPLANVGNALFDSNFQLKDVQEFRRTEAVQNLSIADGVRFRQPMTGHNHLIAGDIISGIQDDIWTYDRLDSKFFDGLFSVNSAIEDFIKFFQKASRIIIKNIDHEVFDNINPIRLLEFSDNIKKIDANFRVSEKVALIEIFDNFVKLINTGSTLLHTTNFVMNSDLVVPLNSQLGSAPNIFPNNSIFNGTSVFHMSVLKDRQVGDRVNQLLNTTVNSNLWGPVPASTAQIPLQRSSNDMIKRTSSRDYPIIADTVSLTIEYPDRNTVARPSENLSVILRVNDITNLEYVEIGFQGEYYMVEDDIVENEITFNIPVSFKYLNEQRIVATAYYNHIDSVVIAYAGVSVHVVPKDDPQNFSCMQNIFYCYVDDEIRPGFEVIYPDFIHRFGVDPNLTANILGNNIVEFIPHNSSFIAKAVGATYVELDYLGLKDTIYFIIEPRAIIIPDANANLSALAVSQGELTPVFNSVVFSYSVDVANDVSSLTITATPEDPAATVTGAGLKQLATGANVFTIAVTAADGITKLDYVVTVNRAPDSGAATYQVTVVNGSGSGPYSAGVPVYIIANAASAGQRFKDWTSAPAGIAFDNATAASTAFTMPAHNVTVTANYEPITPPDPPTNVEENVLSELKIYPNPFTGNVRITGAGAAVETRHATSVQIQMQIQMQVINAAGALVHTQMIESDDETIRLEHLPAGVYMFRFEKDGNVRIERVVKD